MAILEALAHKTAVLISSRCYFPDVASFGAGLIVNPCIKEIESGLRSMLANPERLATMGSAGCKLVSSNYTWTRVADLMIDAYGEGLERHKLHSP